MKTLLSTPTQVTEARHALKSGTPFALDGTEYAVDRLEDDWIDESSGTAHAKATLIPWAEGASAVVSFWDRAKRECPRCPLCDSTRTSKWGRSSSGKQRRRCNQCSVTWVASADLPGPGMRLDTAKLAEVVRLICDDAGIRETERQTGVHRDTIIGVRDRLRSESLFAARADSSTALPAQSQA